jgi:hypothetical protein
VEEVHALQCHSFEPSESTSVHDFESAIGPQIIT